MENFRNTHPAVRQALVIWGGWEGHQPATVAHILATQLAGRQFALQLCDNLAELEQLDLGAFDLIVPVWSQGIHRPQTMNRILQGVRDGIGLAAFHGAIDWFADREYAYMIGGSFVFHPAELDSYRVHFAQDSHPVTAGMSDFEIRTEQYYLHSDPANRVLTTTRFGDTIMPNTWVKNYGRGRVFYTSLAHAPEQIQQWQVLSLLTRGMQWAAGEQVYAEQAELVRG